MTTVWYRAPELLMGASLYSPLRDVDCLISGVDCLISGCDCLISGVDCLIHGDKGVFLAGAARDDDGVVPRP